MAGRVYVATYRIPTVTAAQTLMYLTAAANTLVEVVSAHVTNEDNDTNEQFSCQWHLVTSLGTPTATSVTPAKVDPGDQAATTIAKANVTASEPTYAAANVDAHGVRGGPLLAGYHFEFEPFIIGATATHGLRLFTAIASTGLCVDVRFREIGG